MSGWELLIVLAVALLLFGRKLPEVGRSLGKGIVEFKKGIKGVEEEVNRSDYDQRRFEGSRDARAPLPTGDERRVSQPPMGVQGVQVEPRTTGASQ
jgi:sec-independent protein translocase protein TatA